jgi:hypothetical protein
MRPLAAGIPKLTQTNDFDCPGATHIEQIVPARPSDLNPRKE